MRVHENGGYERLRVGTVQHAMVGMLREPPSGFEAPIRAHFLLKRESILALVRGKWLAEAETSDTMGHRAALGAHVENLAAELATLGEGG